MKTYTYQESFLRFILIGARNQWQSGDWYTCALMALPLLVVTGIMVVVALFVDAGYTLSKAL